jgi:hypothetical protein
MTYSSPPLSIYTFRYIFTYADMATLVMSIGCVVTPTLSYYTLTSAFDAALFTIIP